MRWAGTRVVRGAIREIYNLSHLAWCRPGERPCSRKGTHPCARALCVGRGVYSKAWSRQEGAQRGGDTVLSGRAFVAGALANAGGIADRLCRPEQKKKQPVSPPSRPIRGGGGPGGAQVLGLGPRPRGVATGRRPLAGGRMLGWPENRSHWGAHHGLCPSAAKLGGRCTRHHHHFASPPPFFPALSSDITATPARRHGQLTRTRRRGMGWIPTSRAPPSADAALSGGMGQGRRNRTHPPPRTQPSVRRHPRRRSSAPGATPGPLPAWPPAISQGGGARLWVLASPTTAWSAPGTEHVERAYDSCIRAS